MARLRFRISAALRRWCARRDESLLRFRMMNLADFDDRPRGPGWFDSSWDLGQGLELQEALPGDPVFTNWIEAMTRYAAVAQAPAALQRTELADAIEFVLDDNPAWAAPQPREPDAAACNESELALPDLQALDWAPPELELVPI